MSMDRKEVVRRMEIMQERGISFEEIAEYLVYNYMPASEANDALESLAVDNDFTFEEEEEEEEEAPTCDECGDELNLDGECEYCNDQAEDDEDEATDSES